MRAALAEGEASARVRRLSLVFLFFSLLLLLLLLLSFRYPWTGKLFRLVSFIKSFITLSLASLFLLLPYSFLSSIPFLYFLFSFYFFVVVCFVVLSISILYLFVPLLPALLLDIYPYSRRWSFFVTQFFSDGSLAPFRFPYQFLLFLLLHASISML